METWSSTIQGIELLDRSRELRFRDDHAELLLHVLDIGSARTIAELGCGPGALSRALSRWLGPGVGVVGIDLDAGFVHYAQRRAAASRIPNVHFIEGDALSLPLRSGSVDACVSYTVIEHLPNEPFIREQARVCRPGGRVIVMLTLPEKSLASMPEGWPAITAREQELWNWMDERLRPAEIARGVARYWPGPSSLPKLLEEIGLTSIRVDALALPVVPDDARLSAKQRAEVIETDLRIALERVEMAERVSASGDGSEFGELRQLILARFAKRLEAAERDERKWDYVVSFVLIVGGRR